MSRESDADYSIEFRTLAAKCKWNMEAQWDIFLHGLSDCIHNKIYTLELPTTLDGLIDLAIWVDASGSMLFTNPVVNYVDQVSIKSKERVDLPTQSPCSWAELIFPEKRKTDAGHWDCVCTVAQPVITLHSVL